MSNAFNIFKSRLAIRIISAVAVVLWMGVIFAFSAQNSTDSGHTSDALEEVVIKVTTDDIDSKPQNEQNIIRTTVFEVVRTSAHFICFAVLGALTLIALLTYRMKFCVKVIISTAFSVLYAVSDEIHQRFVPGRTFEWSDIGFDTLGVACGVAVVCLIAYIVSLKRKSRTEKEV